MFDSQNHTADKNHPKSQKEPKSAAIALQPVQPNLGKRPVKRLGVYEFWLDSKIGSGLTADAYMGINTVTFEVVCVKVIDREAFKSGKQQKLLENEIRCHKLCNSNYTVNIHEHFETPSFSFIVTQFCEGGDLYRLLKTSRKGLPEDLVLQFAGQIALALAALKKSGIIHRDIKSENILIHKSHCKLGDFGFAIEEQRLTQEQKWNIGSPLYMSPEALENTQYSFASDIFAFGVVLYEMLHCESPWQCSDEKQLLTRMKSQAPTLKSGISKQLKELISQCLSLRVEDRPSIEDIISRPFLKCSEGRKQEASSDP